MRIRHRLLSGFLGIAVLVAATGYFSIHLSDYIDDLRTVELPMEQHLRGTEVALWEAIHAANAYAGSADPEYVKRYRDEMDAFHESARAYAELTDTPREDELVAQLALLEKEIRDCTETLLTAVNDEKSAEDAFFEYVDAADDVIDYKIQEKFTLDDPNLLAKERAIREVEVSIWEAIHAGEQYTGLTENIKRSGHAQKTFAELMEKQFVDVEEFWAKYKALPMTESERDAAREFEALWPKAIEAGRSVISSHEESREQYLHLYECAKIADDLLNNEIHTFIQQRVQARNRAGKRVRTATTALSILAFAAAAVIGLLISHSICSPLEKLKDAAVAIGEGDLDARVPESDKRSETGVLAARFNTMASNLKRTATLRQETEEKLNVAHTKVESQLEELTRAQKETLRAMEELEQANEEIRRFAYTVSHDLRTPLVNLKGFAGELRASLNSLAPIIETARPHLNENQTKTAAELIQEEMPESLHFIDVSVTRMNHLTNALLKLSRLGRKEMHLENLNMNEVVSKVLQGMDARLQSSGTQVHVEPLPDVVADRTAIEQIMGNLLENAVNYLEPGRPGKIEVGGKRDAEKTVFFVRDNGRGIAREDMAKVFAPFRRAGRQDVQGAGMGLAYVQTLVQRHGGGRVRCESEPGVGTTFTFSIPHPLQQGESHG